MAHIKTKQQIPFKSQPEIQRVGGTYGERRALAPQISQPKAASVRAPEKPIDRYAAKKAVDLSAFNANATYRTARTRFVEGKPAVLHNFENGLMTRKTTEAKPPSDMAILNFLDRVIAAAPAAKAPAQAKPVQRR